MSGTESSSNETWRPKYLVEIDTEIEAPFGFSSHLLRGMRMKLHLFEPHSDLSTVDGWYEITKKLTSWGETPSEISSIEFKATDRGPSYTIITPENKWLAEVQPWGGPKIRPRARISPNHFDIPCGGFLYNEVELILLRRMKPEAPYALEVLTDHLQRNDMNSACELIQRCGESLGEYHTLAKEEWTNPPDQRRWNERFHEIEARLKTTSLWRAPFTRAAPATLDIGDVRFSMFSESLSGQMAIKIGPSRLAHGLVETHFNLPGIRDLGSLLQDLSRQHYLTNTTLELSPLRAALIKGWRITAPPSWCSRRSLSAHTGGSLIWEYEQSLLDVLEATSNQSGRPEPAVTLIEKVPNLQKKLFSARILSSGSWIFGIVGLLGTSTWIKMAMEDNFIFPTMPLVLFFVSYYLRNSYNRAAPPPENPIH